MSVERALGYLDECQDDFVRRLQEFVRIPSVSAQKDHARDMEACADFVLQALTSIGFQARRMKTGGWDAVYGEWMQAGPNAPTVLIYGHYDVQPPEPLEPWNYAPFGAAIENGRMWGRGSADDKGQVWTHLAALEAYLKTNGKLPVNVKMIVEGEEEIGSENLPEFVRRHADLLRGDVIIVSDTPQFAPGVPAITYGLRGLCYIEVRVRGAKVDLHSGGYGGAVPNPIHALARMVAALHDEENRVTVPGFYNDVLPIQDWERTAWANLPFDDDEYRSMLGVPALQGESGYSTLERVWARPTLEVNGIFGGYAGQGAKTVLPCWAGAKISCRLVPRQDSTKIVDALEAYLKRLAPSSVTVEVERMAGGQPIAFPVEGPWMKAGERAMERGFSRAPVYVRLGGSIPIVQLFAEVLESPVLLLGYCHPDCGAHGPDEFFDIADFVRGARTNIYMLDEAVRTTT